MNEFIDTYKRIFGKKEQQVIITKLEEIVNECKDEKHPSDK